jgi:hypothetical protein
MAYLGVPEATESPEGQKNSSSHFYVLHPLEASSDQLQQAKDKLILLRYDMNV